MIRRHIEPVSLYGCKLMGFTNIKNARHRFSLFSFLTIAENLTSLFANVACFSELKKTTRSRSWSWQSILRYTIICYKCKNSQDAVSARSVPCSSPRITRFCHPPRVGILLWGSLLHERGLRYMFTRYHSQQCWLCCASSALDIILGYLQNCLHQKKTLEFDIFGFMGVFFLSSR